MKKTYLVFDTLHVRDESKCKFKGYSHRYMSSGNFAHRARVLSYGLQKDDERGLREFIEII